MSWDLTTDPDQRRTDEVRDRLIEHNEAASEMVRLRFLPEHLPSVPAVAYAHDASGRLLGGCVGHTEDLWHWLTVDLMWVADDQRGTGLGRSLLAAVEQQARDRGCRWAELTTWEFQAPDFYARCGYRLYATEPDYPPGRTNHLMRKDL